MNVIGGKTSVLPATISSQLAGYWREAATAMQNDGTARLDVSGYERFEHGDTVHVVSQDDAGRLNGYACLLPTSGPYMLKECFPDLMHGLPLPCSGDVWELTRFMAADFNKRSSAAVPQSSSEVAIALLRGAVDCARHHGARRLLVVAPIGFERLMRRAGLHSHRVRPPQLIDGHPVFACWIEIDAA